MFKFAILQLVNSKKGKIILEWDEKAILEELKKQAPDHSSGVIEDAWNKMVKELKSNTTRIK